LKKIFLIYIFLSSSFLISDSSEIVNLYNNQADELQEKITKWRRHLHEFPELSNREFKTAKYIESHLKEIGLEVKTGIAKTGIIAILEGSEPGPFVALRADMDALPVVERTGLPYASKQKAKYNGLEVGVMHACGHDAHMAILMGVAEFFCGK
jgi:amidohydrolase